MSMIKVTSLTLSIALGASIGVTPSFASNDTGKQPTPVTTNYETAHLKRKKRSHRHCHTSFINQRLVKTCHKHRHWILHHIRKS